MQSLGQFEFPDRDNRVEIKPTRYQSLHKLEFTLADVYAHAASLAKLHPNNRHVRDKIRQQLQVLRDLGLLQFLGGGSYRLT